MKIIMFLIMSTFFLNSCATIKGWGDKAMFWKGDEQESAEKEEEKKAEAILPELEEKDGAFVKGVTPREMELKQAKIWARMDELENELRIHRAHIQVLEKGMRDGVVPTELLSGGFITKDVVRSKNRPVKSVENKRSSRISPAADAVTTATSIPGATNTGDFKKLMSEGESYFRAGHYGKAIASYEKVGKTVAESEHKNSYRYWVALSWYRLKEFDVAHDEFKSFVNSSQSSPWAPRAHFYMAKIQSENGMIQKALTGYRSIIKKFPYDDTSDMAKLEIDRLEKRL